MRTWQIQQAKAKLSEVIHAAEQKGPQIITSRGVEKAVILPIEEWRRQQSSGKESALDVLKAMPKFNIPIPRRGQLRHRKPVQF